MSDAFDAEKAHRAAALAMALVQDAVPVEAEFAVTTDQRAALDAFEAGAIAMCRAFRLDDERQAMFEEYVGRAYDSAGAAGYFNAGEMVE